MNEQQARWRQALARHKQAQRRGRGKHRQPDVTGYVIPPPLQPMRCQGTTSRGGQCKLDTGPGTLFCVFHQPSPA